MRAVQSEALKSLKRAVRANCGWRPNTETLPHPIACWHDRTEPPAICSFGEGTCVGDGSLNEAVVGQQVRLFSSFGRGRSEPGGSLWSVAAAACSGLKEGERRAGSFVGGGDAWSRRRLSGGGTRPCRPVVAVGISGGVDSAVAAMLLKQQGYDVVGLFMRNWDESDEVGVGAACSADRDLEDARKACRQLDIPLQEVDLVRRYWTDVFDPFLAAFGDGSTPNPDLLCNRHIKFGALLETALSMGADALATGHYARLRRESPLARDVDAVTPPPPHLWRPAERVQLLKGCDPDKDQSYFLAMVDGHALRRALFPVGTLLKSQVRAMAVAAGLHNADRQSSAGICFVGRRKFARFIGEYVEMRPGPFLAVPGESDPHLEGRTVSDKGEVVMGTHQGLAAYTIGQGARISGASRPWFVVGKDVERNAVFVAPGSNHPSMLSTSAVVAAPFWIEGEAPGGLSNGQPLECQYRARYREPVGTCTLAFSDASSREAAELKLGESWASSPDFAPSNYCNLGQQILGSGTSPVASSDRSSLLQVRFEVPERAVTPGQALVLYDGDVCYGGGIIVHPGPPLNGAMDRVTI